jgi:FkbM family methyltransferase
VAHLDHLPQTLSTHADPACEPVNIVISGTTMWNPGDDFVRSGVVEVLRNLYAPRPLNLFFYNFSADVQPPHGRTGRIGNNISAGDLPSLTGVCDAVVIAGLSAGSEIKDLYNWVIEAGRTDRVFMIGAGYENTYVERHCAEEPEATIFRSARFIVGRTEKKPGFLASLGTPYAHLPCPSVLSVAKVKEVVSGARVRRVGFSIQLPHKQGIVNQATGVQAADLAMATMLDLAQRFEVTLIAHHKTEYLAFAPRFAGTGVRVVFESFHQDLVEHYRSLDLMVTTRLHAGLYANAHGVPAIIINDTDRHTHALEGFGHAVWVNTAEGVQRELSRLLNADLGRIAEELQREKDRLMARYLDTLRAPFGVDAASVEREALARSLKRVWGEPAVKHRVLSVISRLTPDHWLHNNITAFREACRRGESWFDTPVVLNWWARAMQPASYMEIGVRRGRSMAQVLSECPETHAYGFDMWQKNYGSIPEKGIVTENPGPEFVAAELLRVCGSEPAGIVSGNSRSTVPAFFASDDAPAHLDLILVDGDHTAPGAAADLEATFGRVAPGGALIFDDLTHTIHPELRAVWESFKARHTDWLFVEDDARNGTGVAIRPPFDRLAARVNAMNEQERAAVLESTPVGSEPGAERLMRRVLREGMIAVDAGAHAGRYSHAMSMLVGPTGRVLTIEPSPGSVRRLRQRVRAQRLDNVVIEPLAVSDAAGTATLNEYGDGLSSWSTLGNPAHRRQAHDPSTAIPVQQAVEVPLARLDDLCEWHGIERVDYLKLDVEGAEPAAARGLERMLARGTVRFLQFEISGLTIDGMNARSAEIFETLTRHGYTCHTITDAGGIGDEVRDSFARHSQYIAIAPKASIRPSHTDRRTPLHFFTIVLNGMPFMAHHINQFRRIDGPWHWHIVEGVGSLVHDTAWSVKNGGRVPDDLHRHGRSTDGTSELIDSLAAAYPDNITVYRKPPGRFWDGKLEMVNAPLANIFEPCLLWQVDSDELWTTEQIHDARRMFAERPQANAAMYLCHYFVGPDRLITSVDTYGNNTSYEWLRTWRFTPGYRWQAHEPPRLVRPNANGQWEDVARRDVIRHADTQRLGLVFQHFAYATESQARFKEAYYGYRDAVAQWQRLQQASEFPLKLRDYLDWVKDEATVERAAARAVVPLIDLSQPRAGLVEAKADACVVS